VTNFNAVSNEDGGHIIDLPVYFRFLSISVQHDTVRG